MGSLTDGTGWPTGVVNARWRWCARSTRKKTSLAHVTFNSPPRAGLVILGIASSSVCTLGRVAVRLVFVVDEGRWDEGGGGIAGVGGAGAGGGKGERGADVNAQGLQSDAGPAAGADTGTSPKLGAGMA